MPELPEVETIAANLRIGTRINPSLIGRYIRGAQLLWERTLMEPTPEEFERRVIDQSVEDIGRRGKFLVMSLSDDTLLFHLRMSGDLVVEPSNTPIAKHHRMTLELEGGFRLAFNDTRKFGRVWLTSNPGAVLDKLGPEPLSDILTTTRFYEMLHARNRQLKPLLMDQSFIAGMGNIYTDEALHRACLHPLRNSHSLTIEEADQLLESMRSALEEGILRNGASIDWVYRGGDFQNYFRVYQRDGEPCPRCGTSIERIIVGQRSTHYCPSCQELPSDFEV